MTQPSDRWTSSLRWQDWESMQRPGSAVLRQPYGPLRLRAPSRAEVEVEKGEMKQGTTSEDNPRTHLSYR